ncbi:MAG: hypothetical protein DHS20C14_16260 [Phycisphaeraceae bacterium]|nr:MAG: hypothetical protein DHS20C14_16260 [Phycisphaeraceae bacterium]
MHGCEIGVARALLDLARDMREFLERAPDKHHAESEFCQTQGNATADARARPRDEGNTGA